VLQAEVEKLIDGSESAIEKQKALRKLMAKGFETPLILRYIKGIDADYFCK
jgi:SOS response regulatory protein OraA/RecX